MSTNVMSTSGSAGRKTVTLWVVEFRWSPRHKWEFREAFATRKEVKEYGWQAVPPAELRIVKYTRVEEQSHV